jgi:hypothetical protein
VWTPLTNDGLQLPALLGSQHRIGALGLSSHAGLRLGFVVLALVVGGAGAVALTWHDRGRGLAAAVGLVAALMVTQAWTSQSREIHLLKDLRSSLAPTQLDWVDRHADGTVGELNLALPQSLNLRDVFTDVYNKRVDRIYGLVYTYHGCPIALAHDGSLGQAGGPSCAPWPRYLVVQRTTVFPTFAGQQVLAATPRQGTLIRIPAGPPRLVGVVQPPCQGDYCLGVLGITVFPRSPGTLAITFGAAPASHVVTLAGSGRRWSLPAGQATTVRLSVGSVPAKLVMPVNWSSSDGAPALQSVVLDSEGTTTRLY